MARQKANEIPKLEEKPEVKEPIIEKKVEQPKATHEIKIISCVSIREQPDHTSKLLGTLNTGEKVQITDLAFDHEFVYAKLADCDGYCTFARLSFVEVA